MKGIFEEQCRPCTEGENEKGRLNDFKYTREKEKKYE